MDLQHYRNALRVNKHRLDDDLETHAENQEQISARVAQMNTAMLHAKATLAQVEARLLQDAKESREKITKDEAEAIVVRHADRRDAWRELQGAREELEEWQGLYDAWRQKGKDMENLGRLYGAQYFALSSVGPDRRSRRDQDYERPVTRPTREDPEKPRRRTID